MTKFAIFDQHFWVFSLIKCFSIAVTSSSALLSFYSKSWSLKSLSIILLGGQAATNNTLFGKFYRTCSELLQPNRDSKLPPCSDLMLYAIAKSVHRYVSNGSVSNPAEVCKLGIDIYRKSNESNNFETECAASLGQSSKNGVSKITKISKNFFLPVIEQDTYACFYET